MKKMFYLLVIIATVFVLNGCKNDGVKLQIIEEDITTNKTKVYEEHNINEGDIIALQDKDFYECRTPNDIKIISIHDEYVSISREKLRYDSSDVHKTYTEEVIENINYNERTSTSINEYNPLSGVCAESKYNYYIIFVK